MQRAISSYCHSGGRIFVSGSYVGSDMNATQGNREFTSNILKFSFETSLSDSSSEAITGLGRTVYIPRLPNEESYAVCQPDCLLPSPDAFSVFVYESGNQSAAIAYRGDDYRTFVMGFPFESIRSETDRAAIMASILHFLGEENGK